MVKMLIMLNSLFLTTAPQSGRKNGKESSRRRIIDDLEDLDQLVLGWPRQRRRKNRERRLSRSTEAPLFLSRPRAMTGRSTIRETVTGGTKGADRHLALVKRWPELVWGREGFV
ncbi:hypothetical protein JCGZ_26730 [Jatropha curcas]|uniref:Uncharacterized protein n=1 Tax=Jatropha curcas TaxID=180498 RepID=A0A067JJ98_JATCU|nr:hypothetical protein JCGZ_26730 [Jatropha curcas]